jgi:uncharacterized protein (TIGR02452 family)
MRTLDSSERFMVDIITCPAPNLRTESHNRFNPDDVKTPINDTNNLEKVLTDRIGLILNTAVDNRAKYLVLGAFGCGAFKNPPALVAEVFKKLLNGKFEGYFKEVVFAIYCNKYNSENYEIFKEVFDK